MLRTELITGYLIAEFAGALVPKAWPAHALQAVGSIPYVGYLFTTHFRSAHRGRHVRLLVHLRRFARAAAHCNLPQVVSAAHHLDVRPTL